MKNKITLNTRYIVTKSENANFLVNENFTVSHSGFQDDDRQYMVLIPRLINNQINNKVFYFKKIAEIKLFIKDIEYEVDLKYYLIKIQTLEREINDIKLKRFGSNKKYLIFKKSFDFKINRLIAIGLKEIAEKHFKN